MVGGVEQALDAGVYRKLRGIVGDANAVEGFVVLGIGFSYGGVFDVCGGEEISFVGCVDEDVASEDFSGSGAECENAIVLLEDGEDFIEGR